MFTEEPFQANHETNSHRANQIEYESYKYNIAFKEMNIF